MTKRISIYISLMVLCAAAAAGCAARHEDHDHNHETGEEHHAGEIIFSEERQAAFGVQTETVAYKSFSPVIRASGTILSAAGEDVTVSATTSGVFHFSGRALSEGSYLTKGSTFAIINTENTDGGDQVSRTRAAMETAEREYLRDSVLIQDNIISVSHYDQSRLEYQQAKSAYEALTKSGYTPGKGLNVQAPENGYLQALFVSEGQFVTAGEPLAAISRNRRLQLRVEVPEKYYPELKDIVSANFKTADGLVHRLSDLDGRLTGYGRSSSGHHVPVNFEFDNKVQVASGSLVDVYLIAREQQDAIVLPLDAVTESQGVYSVYVRVPGEAEAFLKRDVSPGASDGVNVRILSGIEPGDEVVVKGAVQIRLASMSSVPSSHNHKH